MPPTQTLSLEALLSEIEALPEMWHAAGSCSMDVFRAIVRHAVPLKIRHSVETGSGKSTLLFSHMSEDHKVFALDFGNGSIDRVRTSPLLNAATVEFVEGRTQQTLPAYPFRHKLQLAMIDGPHGYPFPDLEYYHLYPHLDEGALFILDDIQIRTIHNLYAFLKDDAMFDLLEVVDKTAIFRRTDAPVFDPLGDGWDQQLHNTRPPETGPLTWVQRVKRSIPEPVKKPVRKLLGR